MGHRNFSVTKLDKMLFMQLFCA